MPMTKYTGARNVLYFPRTGLFKNRKKWTWSYLNWWRPIPPVGHIAASEPGMGGTSQHLIKRSYSEPLGAGARRGDGDGKGYCLRCDYARQ